MTPQEMETLMEHRRVATHSFSSAVRQLAVSHAASGISTPRFKPLLELPMRKILRPLSIALAILFILGLAARPANAATVKDPLESANRVSHSFNMTLDRVLWKPLAEGYDTVAPEPAKKGVRNFFGNLSDLRSGFNDLLQLNFADAATDFTRVAVNTTIGVAGLFDVASSQLNLQKNEQDFGKTLAHWGVAAGPYVVLPVFGPRTLRDAFAMSVDSLVDPVSSADHIPSRNGMMATKSVDFRSSVLYFDDLISGDDYLFIRDAYLQHREHEVNGGYMEVVFEEF